MTRRRLIKIATRSGENEVKLTDTWDKQLPGFESLWSCQPSWWRGITENTFICLWSILITRETKIISRRKGLSTPRRKPVTKRLLDVMSSFKKCCSTLTELDRTAYKSVTLRAKQITFLPIDEAFFLFPLLRLVSRGDFHFSLARFAPDFHFCLARRKSFI